MVGAWLSLVPVTDEPKQSASGHASGSSPSQSRPLSLEGRDSGQSKSAATKAPAHHSNSNSFLKAVVLHSSPISKRKKWSGPAPSGLLNHLLPLSEYCHHSPKTPPVASSHLHQSSSFEIRELQHCDIVQVKELHSACLPVSYPTWFFYGLLPPNSAHQPDLGRPSSCSSLAEKISLVATLPTCGYFEPMSHHSSSPTVAHHHHIHHPHHITSPLSGRKPISLDIIGSISARIDSDRATVTSIRIVTLCVKSEYQSMGIGKALVNSLIQTFSAPRLQPPGSSLSSPTENPAGDNTGRKRELRFNLHVQATNRLALKFYLKLGFQVKKFKKDYYDSCQFRHLPGGQVEEDEHDEKELIDEIEKLALNSPSSFPLSSSSSSSSSPSSASSSRSSSFHSPPHYPDRNHIDFNSGSQYDAYFLELVIRTNCK